MPLPHTGILEQQVIWIFGFVPAPKMLRGFFKALQVFGAPLANLSLEDLSQSDTVFQIGVAPFRIDLLTSITGVDFARAWQNKIAMTIEGQEFFCIGLNDLLANKKATGRPKDLADIDSLENL